MRVIAGTAKGRRLGPVPPGTRPVSDRAREGLFASLGPDVEGARCLDLFAGTGALGIEALSRGAAGCTFVDRSRAATAAIRVNLRLTGFEEAATVACRDALAFAAGGPGPEGPCSLVFLDPPYETSGDDLGALVEALAAGWLDPDGWTVVVTRGHKGSLPAVPVHWAARRHLRYGDSLVILYTEVGWA
jgi:16S rRNA (guanine966-N2)-methyltransferase